MDPVDVRSTSVAPPRRTAPLGSETSILEDLKFARDAGGIAKADASRLAGSSTLLWDTQDPSAADLTATREWLSAQVRQGVSVYHGMHPGDPLAHAAAESVQRILLTTQGSRQTAAHIRRDCVTKHGCFISADSLRKREAPVLETIARIAFQHIALNTPGTLNPPVSLTAALHMLKENAEIAARAVDLAAQFISQRAEIDNEDLFQLSLAQALWSVAQLGVLPVYALDRLRQMGVKSIDDQTTEYILDALIHIPFQAEPRDLTVLATATKLDELPEPFYTRLLATPIMRPLVERFLTWLSGHDPTTCEYHNNDVILSYCSPHYYAAMCEALTESIEEEPP